MNTIILRPYSVNGDHIKMVLESQRVVSEIELKELEFWANYARQQYQLPSEKDLYLLSEPLYRCLKSVKFTWS